VILLPSRAASDPSFTWQAPLGRGGGCACRSYEAKAFGVVAGCRTARARNSVRSLTFVSGNFRNTQGSATRLKVIGDHAPSRADSIDDGLPDVGAAPHLLWLAAEMARQSRQLGPFFTFVFLSCCVFCVFVGLPNLGRVARTEILAKIASQVVSRGLVVVDPELRELHFFPTCRSSLWRGVDRSEGTAGWIGVSTIGHWQDPEWSLARLLVRGQVRNSRRGVNRDSRKSRLGDGLDLREPSRRSA